MASPAPQRKTTSESRLFSPPFRVGLCVVLSWLCHAGLHALPVGLDASHRYFTGPGGKPVFLMGYYFWGAVVDGDFIDHPARYQAVMQQDQPYGLNYIRISLGINRFTGTTDPPSWNGLPNAVPFAYVDGKADLDVWDEVFWEGLRNQVEYAAAHGFIAHVAIFDGYDMTAGPQAFLWNNSFWNIDNHVRNFIGDLDTDNNGTADEMGDFWRVPDFNDNTGAGLYQRRLIDRAVAEVGSYDNVMFEIGNETFGADASMRTAIINYFRTKTTKLITVNPVEIVTLASGAGDGASEHPANTPAEVKSRVASFVGKGWPAWEDPDGSNLASASADDLRRSAWYSLAGGAAGWGGFSYDVGHDSPGFNSTTAEYYGNLVSFLNASGARFWNMVPMHNLLGSSTANSCLADDGREYLVYILSDSSVSVNLSSLSGNANYRTYDPKTGVFSSMATVSGGRARTFNRPAGAADWVLHIVKNTTDYTTWTTKQPWNAKDRASMANPDQDSVPNIMEYALDLDPLDPDHLSDSPRLAIDTTTPGGPWITFTYRKNHFATDLTVSVGTSTDLIFWNTLEIDGVNVIEEIADPDPDGDGSASLVRVRMKMNPAEPRRFLRLQAGSSTGDYATWSAAQTWNAADSTTSANPDSDSFNNLLEYAFGLNPVVSNPPDKGPRIGRDTTTPGGPWITFTYRRNLSALDITYTLGTSTDLTHWAALDIDGANAIQEIADPDPDGDGSVALMRVRVKMNPAEPRRFLRLQIGTSTAGNYHTWSTRQSWNGADSSATANPDSDSFNNLLEYAFDLNPVVADTPDKGPRIGSDDITPGGPWITFTYRRNLDAPDLTFTLRTSTDLSHWTDVVIDGANAIQEIASSNPDGDGSAVVIRVRIKRQPGETRRFLSLKVSL